MMGVQVGHLLVVDKHTVDAQPYVRRNEISATRQRQKCDGLGRDHFLKRAPYLAWHARKLGVDHTKRRLIGC